MKIIDGHKIAAVIEAQLKNEIKKLTTVPCLGIIVFDNDRAGQVYTRLKAEAARRLGIKIVISNTDSVLAAWNNDASIHGILIQRPGYRGPEFEQYWQALVQKINSAKDVDGLRPDSKFVPATVKAVEKIIGIPPRGGMLVIGRGMIGKALAQRFKAENIGSGDANLAGKCQAADILISACGQNGLIQAVKPGATVIDCGWPKGDVDLEAIKNTAGAVTPVPGGVGPVTVVCLLENLLEVVYNRL